MKQKKKAPSRKELIKDLDKLIKKIVKERDNYICQKCGKKVSGRNCHASHVIPVSLGNKLRWDEKNLKVLCHHHHFNFWHLNPVEAAAWFKEKFPKRWAYLEKNRGIQQFKVPDLIELKEKLEKRLKELCV